jgi:hypothetical protein
MKVGDTTAQLGNDGVTFTIKSNDGELLGRFRIGQASVEWAPKNAKMGKGGKARRVTLQRFMDDHLSTL